MKKIYYQLFAMNVGGVEKSWLNLINSIEDNDSEIHLGLFNPTGGYMDAIPHNVIIHVIDCYSKYESEINDPPLFVIRKQIKKGMFLSAFIFFLLYIHFKLTGSRYLFYQYLLRNEKGLNDTFDEAYSYAGPSQMSDFYVCKKIKAKKKYGWIHFDVQKFGIDKGLTVKTYKDYEKIYVVSETAKNRFDDIFPMYSDKTEVRFNIVSEKQIKQLADSGPSFSDNFNGIRILTVGRISEEKGQLEAIKALKILSRTNLRIKWYFVGDGKLKTACEKLSHDLGVDNLSTFLGVQKNPYGFMKSCDIYVQPSRHEGFCITLAEAKCFNHPIVCTDFTGAKEQLKNTSNSIVTGMAPNDIAKAILQIIKDNFN